MLWLAIVPFAAAQERLRLAAIEAGGANGTLSDLGGVQARAEWSTGRTWHVGAQGSWNEGAAVFVYEPGADPPPLGESEDDLLDLAFALRDLDVDSVPVNFLDARPGTPLQGYPQVEPGYALRALCMFRFVHPRTDLRVAGGRFRTGRLGAGIARLAFRRDRPGNGQDDEKGQQGETFQGLHQTGGPARCVRKRVCRGSYLSNVMEKACLR